MYAITSNPIDVPAVTTSVRDNRAGAVVLFLGTVREITGDVETASLTYEAYEQMAVASLTEIAQQATNRWSLVKTAVVHRIGQLDPGDTAVAVAVSSAHRAAAFEAGQWMMDTIKQQTPVWKKEFYANGSTKWVHPQAEQQSSRDITSSSSATTSTENT